MDIQHVKGSKALLESARKKFCHIFSTLWKDFSLKNSLLVVSEILRLFVNILTLDDKYSLSLSLGKSECLMQPIEMQLSQKSKSFSQKSFT